MRVTAADPCTSPPAGVTTKTTLSSCADARLPALPIARTVAERYRERDLKRSAAETVQKLVVNPDEVMCGAAARVRERVCVRPWFLPSPLNS